MDSPRITRSSIGLREAVEFIADDNPATKLQQADNAAYLPKKILDMKINKDAVIQKKVVSPDNYDKIADSVRIDMSGKNYLPKDEMMILDLLATNNWERPIYWAITVGRNKYMNLQDYFRVEGFGYRLVPIKGESAADRLSQGTVETDLMYDNLMNKFKYGNMNDPDVYIDENNMRMMTNIRNSFNRLATALNKEEKKDSAIAVLDRCFELVPNYKVQYEYFALELVDNYYTAGANDKGKQILEEATAIFSDELNYFLSLNPKFIKTQTVNEEIQRNLFYFQKMERIAKTHNDTETAQKISAAMKLHLEKYNSL